MPLFPGSSSLNQLQRILQVTGLPNELEYINLSPPISFIQLKDLYIEEKKIELEQLIKPGTKDFVNLIDLAYRCLQFMPDKRPTFVEILEHPYFRPHHDEAKEPTTNKRIQPEGKFGTLMALRKEIYAMAEELNEARLLKYMEVNYYERLQL